MPHIQTQTEWEVEMSLKALRLIRDELYVDLRFFGAALSQLEPKEHGAVRTFATDGVYLYYNPGRTLSVFRDNSKFLCRAFLHSVFHCIFSHLWIAGSRKPELWDIACDIMVEYTIDRLEKPSVKRILTWTRRQLYQKLEEENRNISAAVIYRALQKLPKEQALSLQMEFFTDDHSFWRKKDQPGAKKNAAQAKWEKLTRQASIQQERLLKGESEALRQLDLRLQAEKSRRSYQDFLKKFTRIREEMHCDPDAFDLNYYTYGLRLYQNMPLIEPLETREERKIQEFIIVLDTSDSTSGNLIRGFLTETFRILKQQENFFHTCKIRIIQSDNQVRKDQEITDLSQAERFLSKFEVAGGGGTDFRPAFSYVNRLIEQGSLSKPDGLLYFTDGKGIYPKKRPVYQTAFLFLEEYDETAVPPWAMHIRLEPEQLRAKEK